MSAFVLFSGQTGWANTRTWTGASNSTWSTGGNWGGTAPRNSLTLDTATFNSGTYTNQPNVVTTTSVAGITVGAASGAFTLSGVTLSIGGTGITINNGAGAVTISAPIDIGASQSWTNSSANLFNVTGNISNIGNTTPFTLTIAGSGNTTLGGAITDGGSTGTTALTINTTSGTTTLSGANNYTGATTITNGAVNITGINSGGGTYTVGSGSATSTLAIGGGGSVATSNLTLNTNGPTVLYLNSGGTLLVGSGGINVNPNTVNNATVFDFNGGTLKASSNFTFSSNIPVVLTATSVVDTNGFTITDNSFIGYSSSLINGATVTNSGGMTIQGGGRFIAGFYSGVQGNLTVTGSGTTWQSSNYTSASIISGLLTVNTGAFLDAGGEGLTAQGGFTGGGTVENSGALATLNIATPSGTTTTFSGSITGPVNVTMSGAGTEILSGTNTFTGAILVSAGNLQFAQTSALSNNATSGTIQSGGMVTLNVGGTGEFTNGTTGANSVGGVITSAQTFFNAGSMLGLDTTNAGGSFTYAGNLGANPNGTAYGVAKLGTGTLMLTGTNTYTGATTVSAGTLQVGNGTSGTISNSSASTVASGATLAFDMVNGGSYTGTIADSGTVAGAEGSGITNTLGGVISGTGVVTQTGAGTTILTGVDTYNGATTVSAGTLQVGNGTSGSIANSASTVASGATLAFDMATGSTYVKTIANSGTVVGAEGSGITNTLGGVISGTGGVTQTGAGTTVLSVADTYNGATTVSAGTLKITGSINNTTSVAVNTGGTLLFGASNAINHSATVSLAGGTISMQGLSSSSETMGALTLSGNSVIDFGTGNSNTLTFSSISGLTAGVTLTVKDWTGSVYPPGSTTDTGSLTQDRLLFSSGFSLTAAQLSQISFYNDAGVFLGTGIGIGYAGTPEIAPVPEPSTIFGGFCLLALLAWRNRRQVNAWLRAHLEKFSVTVLGF